jgi:hypothetical protein
MERVSLMHDPIDDLVQRWRRDPNASTTVLLCDALRDRPRVPLIEQVGEVATQRHANDVTVLLSVARMYIESQRLAEAQNVLVAAGKQAARDPRVYRWLGEVLLRRGDAERAQKVFERAIQLGARDPETRLWHERARGFRPLQTSAGDIAVAAEVAHSPEGVRPQLDSEGPTAVAHRPASSMPPRGPARAAGAPAAPKAAMAAEEPPTWVPPSRSRPAPPGGSRPPLPPVGLPSLGDPYGAPALAPIATAPPIPERVRRSHAAPAPANNGYHAPAPSAPPSNVLVPHPRDIMDALALSGVFEPQATGVVGAWDRAASGPKRKGAPTLITGMVLFLAASVGVYTFYRHRRAEDHLQGEALLATVETRLHAAKVDTLPDLERDLAHAFQLESRSPRAALDWTRERALVGLVKSGADIAFEDAMARAKDVGVPEEKYAFARVASFLFQGDTAGAAAVLPRWDASANGDAWYETVAGAALERAGDVRARQRYATAARIDPELVVARFGLARTEAFDGGADQAMQLARTLRTELPDRAEPVALVALAWGRDPMRELAPVPPEIDDVAKREAELPTGLKFVPHAVAALRALDRHDLDAARREVRQGLAVADAPGAAVWLGTIALPIGDEELARKGALAALQFSAVYEPARALAARVALYAGRLDEALKATEELEATSADVVVVRAAAAYERADADGVARALDALSPDARKQPTLAALNLAGNVLGGKAAMDPSKLWGMSDDDAPWSDLVAMDGALDAGDLATSDKIAAAWGKDSEAKPLRALRLARLARYESRLDAADTLSETALDHGTVTSRVLWERVFVLTARGRVAEVGPLLARYPLVLGPLATWLSAFANASNGAVDAARGKTAALDPPPSSAPFEARVIAATALGAMKDKKRGTDYVRELLATGNLHPDLVASALALGLRRVDHGKRRPTYE